MLDPTLLLLPNEWAEIIKEPKYKKYILTYFLGKYDDKTDYIKKIANEKNLQIINIPYASGEKPDYVKFGDINIIDADPGEFLGLIKNAEYVFTDSFHACVFSVLFKKDFFAFQRDNSKKMQGRINTLLSNFDLPNRFISTDTNIDSMTINYDMNDILHKELRKDSLEFLLGSIKNN